MGSPDRTTTPRRPPEGTWAPARDRFRADPSVGDAAGVEGRRVSGPVQGFGRLWHKTYRVRFEDVAVEPEAVTARWRERYGEFWPAGNRFRSPVAGIAPGEVALITGRAAGLELSTGVLVLYADATSFSFITPEGHPFAGIITFVADRDDDGTTWAQVELFIRAQDPMIEVAMAFGGARKEDRIWQHSVAALARSFEVLQPEVVTKVVCVDRRRQWRRVGNVRHDAALAAVARRLRFR